VFDRSMGVCPIRKFARQETTIITQITLLVLCWILSVCTGQCSVTGDLPAADQGGTERVFLSLDHDG
jgi:hypothetical protein